MQKEKRYEVLVLGATFAAAGLAQVLGSRCLVVDRRAQPGWEFLGALNFGAGYDRPLACTAAQQLQQEWAQRGCFAANGRINLLDCGASLCRRLEGAQVLLNSAIAAVEKAPEGFVVTTHGTAGFRRWTARRVIDTRCPAAKIVQKSYHALLHTETPELLQNMQLERWGDEGDFVLKCPVPPEASFAQARAALQAQLRQLPAGYRPVLTAGAFACVPDETPPEEDGVEYLISCNYANPLLAYDAGVRYGEEVLRHAAF